MRVRYRPVALRDLEDITLYIAERSGSPEIALSYVSRILARCEALGDNPRSGRRRDDLFPGIRIVPFERRAIITYTVSKGVVRITNIFYGGRDYEALLRKLRKV